MVTACDGLIPNRVSYKFDNQSAYSIYVTLDEKFQYKSGDSYVDSNTRVFTLTTKSSQEVFIESTSVDFSWTAVTESLNNKIYCVVDENKATFKER